MSRLKNKESGTPPRRRRPEEGLEFERRGSWKAEWAEVAIDFRCHRSGPKVFELALKKGWLQVEIKKSVKVDEREKGRRRKHSIAAASCFKTGSACQPLTHSFKPWVSMSHR